MKRGAGMLSGISGKQLQAWRGDLGLTQAELGALLGISKTEVYRKECGERPVTRFQEMAVRGLVEGADAELVATVADFRAARKEIGLLQREVAEYFGVHETLICRIERGEETCRPVHRLAMAALLWRFRDGHV